MKILFVNTFYYPNMIGGTEHSVKFLAESLRKRGNEVAVLTIDSNKNSTEVINSVVVYRVGETSFNYKARFWNDGGKIHKVISRTIELYNYQISKQFEKIINEFRPDVIHTNNLYGVSPYVWKLSKKYKVPLIHTIRDYFLLEPNSLTDKNNLYHKTIKFIYRCYFSRFTRYVDIVTAPSQFVIDKFQRFGYFPNAKKQRVWNAVPMNIDEVKKSVEYNKSKINHKTIFLYVGALLEIKGIKEMFAAFDLVKNCDWELRICGDGPLKEFVLEKCKLNNRFKYLGQLKSDEVDFQRKLSDVAIVPSVWDEPFGRVVIEANKYGIPVIGSNRGGIQEVLNFSQTGVLYQYNDVSDLYSKIVLMCEPSNRHYYESNISEAITAFDIENQTTIFEDIYREAIGL